MPVCPQCGRSFDEPTAGRCPECGADLAEAHQGRQEPPGPDERPRSFLEFDEGGEAAPSSGAEDRSGPPPSLADMPDWAIPESPILPGGVMDGSMIEVEEEAEAVRPVELEEAPAAPMVSLSVEEETDLLNRAAAELRSPTGSVESAIELCQQVLSAHPASRRGRALLADIYEAQRRYDQAMEQCQAFLLMEPTNARIQGQLERLQRARAAARPMAAPLPSQPAPWGPAAGVPPPGPPAEAPSPGAPAPPAPTYSPPGAGRLPDVRAPYSGWAIAAFASAFLCMGCFVVPMVLGLHALSDARSRGLRGRELAIAAIVISGLWALFSILYALGLYGFMRRTIDISFLSPVSGHGRGISGLCLVGAFGHCI